MTHPILFIPGPTEVDDELRQIMAMPLVGHRSAGFTAEAAAVAAKLRPLFGVDDGVALFDNVPASGIMEAAIRNLVRGPVLHFSCGAFGERWAKMSAACGRQPTVVAVGWGQAVTPDLVREHLGRARYDAVCFTHCETSTGVLNPLPQLAATVREVQPDALVLVDAVTSLGGAELHFDRYGLDLALAGTQKCLALPPGLAVFAVSARALARAQQVADRGWLLDFVRMAEEVPAGKCAATPCVPLVYALSRQLDRIAAEGLPARWQRHAAMRDEVVRWCAATGFEPFVEPAYRSPTVTTIAAGGRSVPDLQARAKARGFTLGAGYGKLKESTFRVGHMGDHDLARVRALLDALS